MKLFQGIFNQISKMLTTRHRGKQIVYPGDFERLRYEIRPCDVILVRGDTHVSEVIKVITQSHWSHTALYIGRLHEIESETHRQIIIEHCQCDPEEQLLIESELGKGTTITPLSYYKDHHTRICRPEGLLREDAQKIITYATEHLGREYDVRQILDLARFMFPWNLFPRRWRSSLFKHNAGTPTREVCSTLIAEAFMSVGFPILPMLRKDEGKKVEFIRRNPRLFTPSDFDFSPYFKIIKYPLMGLEGSSLYSHIPWNEKVYYSDSKYGDKLTFHPLESQSEDSNEKDDTMQPPNEKKSE